MRNACLRLGILIATIPLLASCSTHISYRYFPASPRAGGETLYVKKYDYRQKLFGGSEHEAMGAFEVDLASRTAEFLPGFSPRVGRAEAVFDARERMFHILESTNGDSSSIAVETPDRGTEIIGQPRRRYLDRMAICVDGGGSYVFVPEARPERCVYRVWRLCYDDGATKSEYVDFDAGQILDGSSIKGASASQPNSVWLVLRSKGELRTVEVSFENHAVHRDYRGEFYCVGSSLVSPRIVGATIGPVQRLTCVKGSSVHSITLPVPGEQCTEVSVLSEVGVIYLHYRFSEAGVLIDASGRVIARFGFDATADWSGLSW